MQIIKEKYSKLISEEKLLLKDLEGQISKLADAGLEKKFSAAAESLDNLFSIVFIGEFSTGKSSIINNLIGMDVLPEGITPTTDRITIIEHGGESGERTGNGNLFITVPQDRLKDLYIVDTPGTNVTVQQHQQITEEFIPNADIVFFTIGAERAVTGSEARLIDYIKRDWLKNIVFILNKIDIVRDDSELESLINHTRGELERIFNFNPEIIPVSARLAGESRKFSDEDLYRKSGFHALEQYIFTTLGEEERVRLKVRNSSEVALSLCDQCLTVVKEHLEDIERDSQRIREFEARLESLKREITQNSSQFTERIRSRLMEFKARGIVFIDELIRFSNIFKLMSKDKVAKEFEYKVLRETVRELERDLDDMVQWTEKSARSMLDDALSFYNKSLKTDGTESRSGFTYDRTRLIDTVRRELEEKRQRIDPALLGGNLVDSARGAVASVLGVQVGTLALGAVFVSAFSSLLVDITGIVATVAVMATAFAILPKKRRDAMKEFTGKVDALNEELVSSVGAQIERDFDGIKIQITDALVPLRNFNETERRKLEETESSIREIQDKFDKILTELDNL